jgi:hypothetical protein
MRFFECCVVRNTNRAGQPLALVGPIFTRSYSCLKVSSETGFGNHAEKLRPSENNCFKASLDICKPAWLLSMFVEELILKPQLLLTAGGIASQTPPAVFIRFRMISANHYVLNVRQNLGASLFQRASD